MRERDPFQPALERIHAKLEQLRTLDLTYQIVGAKTHRYRVKPCLEASRIEALECRYKIHLPEEYRRFLQEVSNGGAGPNHGLFSLE